MFDKRRTDQHGRKLDPGWLGLFYIQAPHPNGSSTLEDTDGRLISGGKTYNLSHLKIYNER